ncbi:MAG: cytochrome c family protein [Alphaproteobacteria bacterium]|nr:cytochrome c family protein [Alphaproteobacteria bacterium]
MPATRSFLVLLLAQFLLLGAAAAGDAANGEKVFAKCRACHSVEPGGRNQQGPNLHGVVGRPAGKAAGFNYSKVLLQSGVVWTEDKLDAYLADPKGMLPGNRMLFIGLKQAKERSDVIAYLKQTK